jgi:hypothetical protein
LIFQILLWSTFVDLFVMITLFFLLVKKLDNKVIFLYIMPWGGSVIHSFCNQFNCKVMIGTRALFLGTARPICFCPQQEFIGQGSGEKDPGMKTDE